MFNRTILPVTGQQPSVNDHGLTRKVHRKGEQESSHYDNDAHDYLEAQTEPVFFASHGPGLGPSGSVLVAEFHIAVLEAVEGVVRCRRWHWWCFLWKAVIVADGVHRAAWYNTLVLLIVGEAGGSDYR